MQILETHLEFVLRPCQRALVDHWPRPTPAIMAQFFTGVDILVECYKAVSRCGLLDAELFC
jgi:hypothetical protein